MRYMNICSYVKGPMELSPHSPKRGLLQSVSTRPPFFAYDFGSVTEAFA